MNTKINGLQHGEVPKATNENIDTAIISQVAMNEKISIKKEVEEILGYTVDEQLFQDAYEYSKHKLNWQSKLYDTQYDERYTAIVTAENYEQQIFSEYMNNLSMKVMKTRRLEV